MGQSIFLGLSDTARKVKALWIGDANGKAHKIKAAWIGVGGIAKQFYLSIVKIFAISAYERGGSGSTTGDIKALKKGSGYAAIGFPANDAFADCQKLTLHFYVVSNNSNFNTISVRDGATKDGAFSVDASIATPIPEYEPTDIGWQSVDVTIALDAASGGVTRDVAAANGVKVFMRSRGNTVVGGIGGEYCPYLTIE